MWFVALLSALLAASAAIPATAKSAKQEERAYIVVLREGADVDHGRSGRGKAKHVFRQALKGYAADLTEDEVAALQADPQVALIEPDGPVEALDVQVGPTWGLDRIDERDLPLDGSYVYPAVASTVTAYVIDTGINVAHADFGGRASLGYSAIGGSAADCNGHGTHVAGTIGGTTYGVAKQANLVAVRVLDCNGSGSYSSVIAGVEWVTQNAAKPAVANMSLGGGPSSALDQAVAGSIAAGITYAVAAGNSNANACNYSPARVPAALTVGATTISDSRSSFSNHGSCLDLFAPGSSITSAWWTSATATNTISGTSMASPHVAGAAALYLGADAAATPSAVRDAIIGAATPNKVTSAGTGSPNLLLTNLFSAEPPPPPANQAPTASFTRSCTSGSTSSTCTFTSTSTDPENQTLTHVWTGATPTGSSTTATRTVSAAGSYAVTLQVQDSAGAWSNVATRTISCSWSGKNHKRKLSCS